MKHTKKNKRSIRVNQVKITFTGKSISAWGGMAALAGKFLEGIGFQGWVEKNIPIKENSHNAKGIYEKIEGQFLTVLAGGSRFQHVTWWGQGKEVLLKAFKVNWLPQAGSVMTRFWGKIDSQANSEQLGQCCREFARKLIGWDRVKEDNLNLDSSVLTRYGNQQGAVRDLINTKIPFIMSSNFKSGGIEDEDIDTDSKRCILTDGGLGCSFG